MLSTTQIDAAEARYRAEPKPETIDALAQEYGATTNQVRHALGKRGAFGGAAKPPADAERPTDDELGIGEDDEAGEGADPLMALLADPRMSALIEQAVAQRVEQLTQGAVPAAQSDQTQGFEMLAKTLGRLIEVNQMQQPGYVKPLPAEEVERRLAGRVEMDALIARYKAKNLAPLYTVGESGFFECTNALEFPPGAQIRTFLPPVEDFIPENEPAAEIHAAMMVWLGGRTPHIGDQVEAAMREAKLPPMVGADPMPLRRQSPVEMVKEPPASQARTRRVMGSITPERHGVSLAERAAGPHGPVFVGADAV